MSHMRLDMNGAVIAPQNLPVHNAEDLTKGGTQANIVLGDQVYNLRITRAGKLILTK
jgi:hemin uptake protein HemP